MATNTGDTKLVKGLGLLDATMIVTGGMIGSGIFIVSADIARQVNSPGLLLATWVITAVLTLIAALSYGELAAAMPQAGGQYIYLREAFGKLPAFLFGWTFFVVIQTGTIAAVAVAFAKFAGVFFPSIQGRMLQFVGIGVIVILSWVNTRGVRTGAIVQNVFTIAKIAALLGLVILGLALGRNETAVQANFGNLWANADWTWAVVSITGVAMVGSLPLAAIQTAPQDRVGTAVVQSFLGLGAEKWMAAAIMVSTFGCVNGLILAGSRVYYAMAKDGLFFKVCGKLDPKSQTPVVSIAVQCLWACGLTLTGRYGDLLDYVIFAVLLFYILTIWGIFVLRRKRPEMERPYKAIGYPVLPFLYIVFAGLIEILLLLYKPNYTWPGLIIVLLGIPVYFIWKKNEVVA